MTIDMDTGAAILTVTSKTHGTFQVLVDVEDWKRISEHTWSAMRQPAGVCSSDGKTRHFNDYIYFGTRIRQPDGRYKAVQLHRFIMGNPAAMVGNQPHDYFDCRKSAFRAGARKQVNERMRKTIRCTSSRFKGVSWIISRRRYQASISIDGRMKNLGRTYTEEQAARVYDIHALANYTNPLTNFPIEDYAGIDLTPYAVTVIGASGPAHPLPRKGSERMTILNRETSLPRYMNRNRVATR